MNNTDAFNEADLELSGAYSLLDCLYVLSAHGNQISLYDHSLTETLHLAMKQIERARAFLDNAHLPVASSEVNP